MRALEVHVVCGFLCLLESLLFYRIIFRLGIHELVLQGITVDVLTSGVKAFVIAIEETKVLACLGLLYACGCYYESQNELV